MYGKNKYGLLQYARDSTPDSTQTEYYIDLKQYVPPFVYEKVEMDAIYTAQGYEVGLARYNLEDLVAQCFVSSATWGLLRWEEVFGVATNMSLSYEQRREIITAKIRGQGTTTVEMIKGVAEAFLAAKWRLLRIIPITTLLSALLAFTAFPVTCRPSFLCWRKSSLRIYGTRLTINMLNGMT